MGIWITTGGIFLLPLLGSFTPLQASTLSFTEKEELIFLR